MTSQEIFNTVLSHLRAQGPCMLNGMVVCRYRGGIGALIPDELYQPCMERMLIPGLIKLMQSLGEKYISLYEMFKTHE